MIKKYPGLVVGARRTLLSVAITLLPFQGRMLSLLAHPFLPLPLELLPLGGSAFKDQRGQSTWAALPSWGARELQESGLNRGGKDF